MRPEISADVSSRHSGAVEITAIHFDQGMKCLFINKLHLNTNFLDVQAVSSYRITSN